MPDEAIEGDEVSRGSAVALNVDTADELSVDGQEQASEVDGEAVKFLKENVDVLETIIETTRRSAFAVAVTVDMDRDMSMIEDINILATDDIRSSEESTAEASSELDIVNLPMQSALCGAKTDETAIVLKFRRKAIAMRCAIGTGFLFAWCLTLYFWNPPLQTNKVDKSDWDLKNYSPQKTVGWFVSFLRTALPMMLLSVLKPVVTALDVDRQLQLDTTSGNASVRRWIRAGLIYGLTYSLVSIDTDQERRQIPGIIMEDLFNREELERRLNTDFMPLPQHGNGSFVRTNLTNTMLRGTVQSFSFLKSWCTKFDNQPSNVDTGVAYGFVSNDWQSQMLPFGLEPSDTYVIPGSSRQSNLVSTYTPVETSDIESFEDRFVHAVYLYIHEVQALYEDSDFGNASVLQKLKQGVVEYANSTHLLDSADMTQRLESYVRSYFISYSSTWSSLLRVNVSEIIVEVGKFNVSEGISYTTVNLDIPLNNYDIWQRELKEVNGKLQEQPTTKLGDGGIRYEFDVARECSQTTCAIQNRGASPEPKVSMYGTDDQSKTLLFGFGRRIEGDTLELLSDRRKAVAVNLREFHRVSMGLLEFEFEDLDMVFNARCLFDFGCRGLRYQLEYNNAQEGEPSYLIVHETISQITRYSQMLSLDIETGTANGLTLVTRYSAGSRVKYEILHPQNFRTYAWNAPLDENFECSGVMERSAVMTEHGRVYMEDPVQVMYTSAMFHIFQDAKLLGAISSSSGLSLDFMGNDRYITITAAMWGWQCIIGMCFSVVLALLCLHLHFDRHDRISLWSLGQLQHSTVLIRALADSDNFPPSCTDIRIKQLRDPVKAVSMRGLKLSAMEFESKSDTEKLESTMTYVLRQPQTSPSSPRKKPKLLIDPIKNSIKELTKTHPKPPPGWLDEF